MATNRAQAAEVPPAEAAQVEKSAIGEPAVGSSKVEEAGTPGTPKVNSVAADETIVREPAAREPAAADLAAPVSPEQEEAVGEKRTLRDVVVTATRGEQAASEAPASTSVVTKEEMRQRNVQTADQAVNLLPGVYGRRGKGLADTRSSITVRGVPGQDRTLVLLDGLPMNDGYTGDVQLGGLRLDEFERIEVVRGPVSSLYGGSAMGGAVNLLTVMPEKREVRFNSGVGSAWTWREAPVASWKLQGSYGDRVGKLRLQAGFGYEATAGFPANLVVVSSAPTAGITGARPTTDATGKARYVIGHAGNNTWNDYSGTVRLQYDFTASTYLRLWYRRSGYEYAYDDPASWLQNGSGSPVYSYGTVSQSVFVAGGGQKTLDSFGLASEILLGETRAKIALGVNRHGTNWYTSSVSGASGSTPWGGPGKVSNTPDTSFLGDLQVTQPILQRHLLTAGVAFRRDQANTTESRLEDWRNDATKGDATYEAGGINLSLGAFVQAEIALLDSLTLYAGLRDDYWRTYAGYAIQRGTGAFTEDYAPHDRNSLSPKGALVWRPLEGTTLRTQVGRAFRAPSVYELYRTWTSVSGQKSTVYGSNAALSPESIVSWDVGGEQALWRQAKAKATFFDNYLRDMVYTVTLSDSATAAEKRATNVGRARSYGVELELEQKVRGFGRLFAAYTYTKSAITKYDVNPALVGKQLTHVPKHMASAGAEAKRGPFSGSVTARHVSKRFNSDDNADTLDHVYGSYDPYLLVDLLVAAQPEPWMTISLSVDNLFDQDVYCYYRTPRRSWMAQLTLAY